jgi:hypothetical protein
MYRSVLFALALFAVGGCGPTLPPVNTSLAIAGLKAGEVKSSRQNVSIDVRPVTYTDLSSNRGLLMKIRWQEVDRSQATSAGAGMGQAARSTKEASDIVPLVPVPTFIVRVVNHSGKTLDFSNAQVQLVDDKGKQFELYKDAGAVVGHVQDDIIGVHSQMQNQKNQLDSIADAIGKMQLLTKKTQIADGADWQGYLLFKMESHGAAELDKYLQSVGKLTVQVNGIGGDSQPAQIEVPIEKVAAQLPVTCEGGKPQDFAHCQQQPFGD